MPKMKSKRAAAKRFKISASGRIKREQAYASHYFTSKASKRKRRLRKAGEVHSSDMRRIKRLIQV